MWFLVCPIGGIGCLGAVDLTHWVSHGYSSDSAILGVCLVAYARVVGCFLGWFVDCAPAVGFSP